MRANDPSVLELRKRLVGKTVTSVEASDLSETFFFITTSDGGSFHIGGTDLGAWITPGKTLTGLYASMATFAEAVDSWAQRSDLLLEDVLVETVADGTLRVTFPNDGAWSASIGPDAVEDPFEKAVLSHPKAEILLKEAVLLGPFWRTPYRDGHEEASELRWTPSGQDP